jgi:chromosome segregation ATPase
MKKILRIALAAACLSGCSSYYNETVTEYVRKYKAYSQEAENAHEKWDALADKARGACKQYEQARKRLSLSERRAHLCEMALNSHLDLRKKYGNSLHITSDEMGAAMRKDYDEACADLKISMQTVEDLTCAMNDYTVTLNTWKDLYNTLQKKADEMKKAALSAGWEPWNKQKKLRDSAV